MKAMIALILAAAAWAGPAPQPTNLLKGKAKEVLDAGQYTYILIATKDGDKWAAVNKAPVKKGQEVSVLAEMTMDDFDSKILKRRFDHVAFGSLESEGAAAAKGQPNPHAGMMQRAPTPQSEGPVKLVSKAEGPEGRTIAELFSQKKSLAGKTVAVRGRVVKYNGGIMGANWVHLRDGSGGEKAKDNDVTVTTQDKAELGEIVTARGQVSLDKDLGAGYYYPVIIEKAALERK